MIEVAEVPRALTPCAWCSIASFRINFSFFFSILWNAKYDKQQILIQAERLLLHDPSKTPMPCLRAQPLSPESDAGLSRGRSSSRPQRVAQPKAAGNYMVAKKLPPAKRSKSPRQRRKRTKKAAVCDDGNGLDDVILATGASLSVDSQAAAVTLQSHARRFLAHRLCAERREAVGSLEDMGFVRKRAVRELARSPGNLTSRRVLHAAAALASERMVAVQQLQCAVRVRLAQRQRAVLQAEHDEYWGYAFGLLREDAAERIQRVWRTRIACARARSYVDDLREWTSLKVQLREASQLRWTAALTLQRMARRWQYERVRRSWVTRRSLFFAQKQQRVADATDLNPFSESYVGQEEHRRRVEEEVGTLRAFGKPKGSAMHRALPAQVATLLNVLRLVDAINALLSRGLVVPSAAVDAHAPCEESMSAEAGASTNRGEGGMEVGRTLGASYDALTSWGDGALQARFSGATQYLKSAKRFGLIHFQGEAAKLAIAANRGMIVRSHCVGCSRAELLRRAMTQPLKIVPAMADVPNAAEKLAARLNDIPFKSMVDAFVSGSFDTDQIYAIVEEYDEGGYDDPGATKLAADTVELDC
jgi:hypothetical protein